MLPTIKQYNIDYGFLISNYLNKELWKKKWNLFVYKDNIFTLSLYYIMTQQDSITFEIKYNKLEYVTQTITYFFNNTTLKVLKQQINGAIFRLMEAYDERLCRNTKGYKDLCDMYDEEKEELRETAKSYLDECGITQDDIREAYAYYQEDKWGVIVKFNNEGSTKFYNLTKAAAEDSLDKSVSIYIGGELYSSPTCEAAISGGVTFISGSMDSQAAAEEYAMKILSGTFSTKLTVVSNSVVSATLGNKALFYLVPSLMIGAIFLLLNLDYVFGALALFAIIGVASLIMTLAHATALQVRS